MEKFKGRPKFKKDYKTSKLQLAKKVEVEDLEFIYEDLVCSTNMLLGLLANEKDKSKEKHLFDIIWLPVLNTMYYYFRWS